jgi:hypothetical protein
MTQEEKELETWLPIQGYEGIYEISNLGRVKRLAYDKSVCNGGRQHCCERILKPQIRKHGYLAVNLSKECKTKSFLIHRLVATAFIPNENNLPQVNHKDENPSNNCVENLEWCNQRYNSNYGTSKERISAKLKNGILSKPVEQYDIEGNYINEYPSAIEASRILHLNISGIVSCCNENSKYSHCGGFQWRYKDSTKTINNILRKIVQYTKSEELVGSYNNVTEASRNTGISRTSIANCLSGLSKTAGGFVWKKITNNF